MIGFKRKSILDKEDDSSSLTDSITESSMLTKRGPPQPQIMIVENDYCEEESLEEVELNKKVSWEKSEKAAKRQ